MSENAAAATPVPGPAQPIPRGRFGPLTIVLVVLLAVAVVAVAALAHTNGVTTAKLSSAQTKISTLKSTISDDAGLLDNQTSDAADSRNACVAEINGLIDAYNSLDAGYDLLLTGAREDLDGDYVQGTVDVNNAGADRVKAASQNTDAGTAGADC